MACNAVYAQPEKQIAEHVAQLSSRSFETRQQAMQRLTSCGLDSIPMLSVAVIDANPEVRWRAVKSLEDIALNGDERALGKVIRVFRWLGDHGLVSLREKSETLMSRWQVVQEQKIIVRLRGWAPS